MGEKLTKRWNRGGGGDFRGDAFNALFFIHAKDHLWERIGLKPAEAAPGTPTEEDDGGGSPGLVHFINQPVQCVIIVLVIVLTVTSNVCIILNIGLNELKRRNTNFVLIKVVCTLIKKENKIFLI
jgi:hypothetical protein